MNKTTESLEMLLTLDNKVFGCFIFWASVLIIKMLLMSILTALQRFRYKIVALIPLDIITKVFISPEDEAFAKGDAEVKENDPHVERVRRAHLNDIENILPFLTMGLLFVCVNPNATLAMVLFRIQGVARIIHTLVYAFRPVPQPSRAIAFFIAYFDTLFMGGYAIVRTIQYI